LDDQTSLLDIIFFVDKCFFKLKGERNFTPTEFPETKEFYLSPNPQLSDTRNRFPNMYRPRGCNVTLQCHYTPQIRPGPKNRLASTIGPHNVNPFGNKLTHGREYLSLSISLGFKSGFKKHMAPSSQFGV
jgi:hypothetical protein